jgi:oxygen-independent coproporphyrinogen-3 oxidase
VNLPLSLYVHFPWCVRKCPYCDFNSHPVRGAFDQAGYLNALLIDAGAALRDVPPQGISSVFLGGGTPSLFDPDSFATLLTHLQPWLEPGAEITMEANPGTVEYQDFSAYREAGISRISLGAQTFNPTHLKRLGRIHGPREIRIAFERVRAGGFENVNLDLMYGLPEQTTAEAIEDLSQALALSPEHVSWYHLTIEPRTEFARHKPPLPSEGEVEVMEDTGRALLEGNGFHRYEVSAWARPGRQCRHNVNYWSFGDYLGIGAGAHGKRTREDSPGLQIGRNSKAAQPRLYLAEPLETRQSAVEDTEIPLEFLMNALRLTDGVSADIFSSRTGLPLASLEPAWNELREMGLMRKDRIATTAFGYRHLDAVLQRFL